VFKRQQVLDNPVTSLCRKKISALDIRHVASLVSGKRQMALKLSQREWH
jgi:hypothetical protein